MTTPYLLAMVTILLWGLGTYLTRLISIRSQFLQLLFSFSFAACVLCPALLIQARQTGSSLLARFRWRYCAIGVLGYFFYSVPLIQGYRAYNGASEMIVLSYTWPVLAVVFSGLLFRRKHRPGDQPSRTVRAIEGLGLASGVLAVGLVATQGDFRQLYIANPAGLGWGLVVGVGYGLFTAYSATLSAAEQPAFLMAGLLTSVALIAPLGFSEWRTLGRLTLVDVGIAALSGMTGNGLAFITWTAAVRRTTELGFGLARIVSLIFLLPPLQLAVIAVAFGEGHLARPYFVLSVVLVAGGSLLAQWPEALAAKLRIVGRRPAGGR